jgi:hypothetical protein
MRAEPNPFALLIVTVVVFLYFLPSVVAAWRKHHNGGAILVLNLRLGWIAALVWSFTEVKPPEGKTTAAAPADLSDTKPCPFCTETTKRQAIRCRYCGSDLPSEEQ